MQCPKCDFKNPHDTLYCGKCGTKFQSSPELSDSFTKTLHAPIEKLTRGAVFAGRYDVIEAAWARSTG